MLEIDVETYLVERVEAHGGRCLKLVDMGRRGFPDRTVLWPNEANEVDPRMHFIETKIRHGEVKPWQKRYHDDLEAMGFLVLVIWTKEQVDEYIQEYAPSRWK